MKRIASIGLAIGLFPSLGWGGLINGTLYQNGEPLAGKDIQIRCADVLVGPARTSDLGAFQLFTNHRGICTLEVVQPSLSHRIYSYKDPIRYDFDLFSNVDGSFFLKRR